MTDPIRHADSRILYVGNDASDRLSTLGLSFPIFGAAAQRGDEGRQTTTDLHPRQSAGQRMWSDTVAELRRQCILLNSGWIPDRTNNYETVTRPSIGVAIAVVGGDEFTGYVGDRDPRVRRKRGPMTERRVRANHRHLGMEPLFPLSAKEGPVVEVWTTWFFLLHASEDELRMELALPVGHDAGGFVSQWSERILLPPLPTSGGVTPIPDDEEDAGGVPAVSRR